MKNQRENLLTLIGDGVEKVISFLPHIPINNTTILTSDDHKFIADEVCYRIVGESSYRWDSVTSYYPTLCFKFKEITYQRPARVSQIRLKYYKTSQDMTDEDVSSLKSRVESIVGFTYNYGELRVNFVSKDKRVKSTLFVETKDDARNLLNSLCRYVETDWSEDDLTYTQGKKRDSITKRKIPLDNVNTHGNVYNEAFQLKLFRVLSYQQEIRSIE